MFVSLDVFLDIFYRVSVEQLENILELYTFKNFKNPVVNYNVHSKNNYILGLYVPLGLKHKVFMISKRLSFRFEKK